MNSYVFHNIISVATLCYGPMPLCLIGMAVSLVAGCSSLLLGGPRS